MIDNTSRLKTFFLLLMSFFRFNMAVVDPATEELYMPSRSNIYIWYWKKLGLILHQRMGKREEHIYETPKVLKHWVEMECFEIKCLAK